MLTCRDLGGGGGGGTFPPWSCGARSRCGHQALPQVCDWIVETRVGAVFVLGAPEALLVVALGNMAGYGGAGRASENVLCVRGTALGFLTAAVLL